MDEGATCEECGGVLEHVTGGHTYECVDCGERREVDPADVPDRYDLAVDICRIVGASPPSSPGLPKRALNSAIAYLTGEYPTEPAAVLFNNAPEIRWFRRRLAQAADLETKEYDRRFYRLELIEIREKLKSAADARPKAGAGAHTIS